MIAILLAAGYATRLYPLTKDKPKSLLPLGNRLIIDYIMDSVDVIPGLTKVALITNSKFYPAFCEWADSQDREGKAPIVVLDDGVVCVGREVFGSVRAVGDALLLFACHVARFAS